MLLATSADRIFGIGKPGTMTAREALTTAGDGLLTAEGFEVRPEFVPDVWALARQERSVTPLGVFEGALGLPSPRSSTGAD